MTCKGASLINKKFLSKNKIYDFLKNSMIVVNKDKILEVDALFDNINLRMKIFVSRFHFGGLNFCVVHSFMAKFHFKSLGFF